MRRPYFEVLDDLSPIDLAQVALVGDDLIVNGLLNRLTVVSATNLAIDPAYTGTLYTFAGPPNPLSSPVQLGFNPGDKILLTQADGQPVGPNDGREFTLLDPNLLTVLETLVSPDSTSYKFYATRKGV